MRYLRHTLCYLDKPIKTSSRLSSQELEFLYSWVAQGYPLITTRQPPVMSTNVIQLAIPYFIPSEQKKFKLSYLFCKSSIKKNTPLPLLSALFPNVSEYSFIRVYGSYCWQYLTQNPYTQPTSDLDILIEYSNQSMASLEALHHHLTCLIPHLKIDGEVRFPRVGDCSYLELISKKQIPTMLFKSERDVKLIARDDLYAQFPALVS